MIWGTTILRNLHIYIYVYCYFSIRHLESQQPTIQRKKSQRLVLYTSKWKANRCEIVLFFKPYSSHMFGENFLTPPLQFLTDGKCAQNPPVWIHNWHFPSFSARGWVSLAAVCRNGGPVAGNWCLCLWGKAEQWVAMREKSNSYVLHYIKNMFIGI
jgi:hypothetical protein